MSDVSDALRLRISGLERELTRINSYTSAAISDRMKMEAWFAKEAPNHRGRSTTMFELERVEQSARDEFARVSQQLQRARRELDAYYEPSSL